MSPRSLMFWVFIFILAVVGNAIGIAIGQVLLGYTIGGAK